MSSDDGSSLVSENPSQKDKVEHLCWYLNQHKDSEVSIQQIADEVGLDWAEAHRLLGLVETVRDISPEVSREGDGVLVGSRTELLDDMYEDDLVAVLSHLFFYNRLNGEMSDSVVIEKHSVLRDNQDVLAEADDLGFVTVSDGKVELTPKGISHIGHIQSRVRANS